MSASAGRAGPSGSAELAVPVAGGELAVLAWAAAGGDGPAAPVVGVHGITANATAFARIATEMAGRRDVLVPDLRGRAHSSSLPGPYGLAQHVRDLVAVLDHFEVPRAILAGHSMGAFVSCLAAVRHPDRVAGVVLIDGGLALPVPPDTDIATVLGPAMARLGLTFPDLESYREYWRAHPAFADRWNGYVDDYIERDLTGEPPELHSTCSEEAVRVDGAEVLQDPGGTARRRMREPGSPVKHPERNGGTSWGGVEGAGERDHQPVLGAVYALPCPGRLLWASRGLRDETPGLYTAARLDELGCPVPARELEGENHYSVMFSSAAAEIVVEIDAVADQAVDA